MWVKRIADDFFDILRPWIELKKTRVLEIGCGDGAYSREIAKRCGALTGIDPDPRAIARARNKRIHKTRFEVGFAESMDYANEFDVVLFMLSFHHIGASYREEAIRRAIKALRPSGKIVFLEPGTEGSYFEAEILFDAGDGDERRQKASARRMLHTYHRLNLLVEIDSETLFRLDSVEDFRKAMKPRKNLDQIERFLSRHHNILMARRHVIICKPIG